MVQTEVRRVLEGQARGQENVASSAYTPRAALAGAVCTSLHPVQLTLHRRGQGQGETWLWVHIHSRDEGQEGSQVFGQQGPVTFLFPTIASSQSPGLPSTLDHSSPKYLLEAKHGSFIVCITLALRGLRQEDCLEASI